MIPSHARKVFYRLAASAAWRRLQSLSGQRIRIRAERAALRAFRRAANRVPAYKQFLRSNGVDATSVRDIEAFRSSVPLTDKESVFTQNDILSLCVDGKADDAACVYTSSGFSGSFSFGLETRADIASGRRMLDLLLEMHFQTASRKTLLISAMPMGVQIPANLPTRLEAGTRTDAALAVIRKLKCVYDQIIIAGEHPLLKKLVEEGEEAGMVWPEYRVSLLTGADVMPESFRHYMGELLGHDPANPHTGKTLVSTGISEVGLSIAQETDECRLIRTAAASDASLRSALFGQTPFLPTCSQYFPSKFFLETSERGGRSCLVVTTSNPRRKLPLIRYCTGDRAKIMTHRQVCEALDACGRNDLRPSVELPFLFLWGRAKCIQVGDKQVYPEQVKEAIYADAIISRATTANFRLSNKGGVGSVRFQLKPGLTEPIDEVREAFDAALLATTGLHLELNPVAFDDFPEGMDVNFHRKFQYL